MSIMAVKGAIRRGSNAKFAEGPPPRPAVSSRSHQLGLRAFIGSFAHLVALVEHLDLLHFLESFRESALGVFELALEIDRGALEVLAPLHRGLGVGWVREVRRIVNTGPVLLRFDLAIEVAGDALELADHDLDLSDLAALLIDLKSLQA